MQLLTIFLIALSLSIDTFTLSLTYGLLVIPKKTCITTSLTVGIFHFIMPLLGYKLGNILKTYVNINEKYILIIVLILIIIEMIKSLNEETKEHKLNLLNILLFSLLVSIDSFTLGIGINYITNKIYLSSLIFFLVSSIFTYLGFKIGKFVGKKLKKTSKLFGIILLIIITVYLIYKP